MIAKHSNLRAVVLPEQSLVNDLDGGPGFRPGTIRNDSTIVSWIEALDFKEYIASDAFKESNPIYPEKKRELEKLANSLKETDNPVLILVKLKK